MMSTQPRSVVWNDNHFNPLTFRNNQSLLILMKIFKNLLSAAAVSLALTASASPGTFSLGADAQREGPVAGVCKHRPDKVKAMAPSGEWKSIGTGVYTEGLFSVYNTSFDGASWSIDVEESVEQPGYYRFIPYTDQSPIANTLGFADETYMYVNATDPSQVYVEDFVPYGAFYFSQIVPENTWNSAEGNYWYGTLSDGVVSFPERAFVIWIDGNEEEGTEGAWYYTNPYGSFRIELPVSTSSTEIQPTDYAVLRSIYDVCGGSGWYYNLWNFSTNSFPGVTFDSEGYVTAIDLSGRGLRGSFPTEIKKLSRLRTLDLSANYLSGDINGDEATSGSMIYLRGEFNDWTAPDEYAFEASALGVYLISGVTISAGTEFKIGDADWMKINYGGGEVYLNTPVTLEYNGSNCVAAEDLVNVTMAFDPQSGVLIVTDNPSMWLNAPARRANVTTRYTPDFITMNGGKTTASYTTLTSDEGWTAVNSALFSGNSAGTNSSPKFAFIGSSDDDRAVVLNGKTSAPGKLTSPKLYEPLGMLSFDCAFPFTDTQAQLKISVVQGTQELYLLLDITGGQYEVQHFDLDFSDQYYNGSYTIAIENKCLSGSSSNKDRVAIFNLSYTTLSEETPVDPDPIDPDPVDPDEPTTSGLRIINISSNQLSGNIGQFAANFPELTSLYARYNRFSQISPTFSDKIIDLDLTYQELDSQVDIDFNGNIMDAVLSMPEFMLMPLMGGSTNMEMYFYANTGSTIGLSWYNGDLYYYLFSSNYYAPNGCSGRLSMQDYDRFQYLSGASTPASLTFIEGDANFDLRLDVADLQTTINYIMGFGYNYFNFYGADQFGDERINVQDVVRFVDLLLANNIPASVRRRIPMLDDGELAPAKVSISSEGYVVLESDRAVSAFDIMLDGVTNVEWTLPSDSFTLTARETGSGIHVVAYSLAGDDLGEGRVVLGRAGAGASIAHAALSTPSGESLPCAISGVITTGIGSANVTDVTVAAFNGAISISSDIALDGLSVSVCDLAGRVLAVYTPGNLAAGCELLIPTDVRGTVLVQLASADHSSTHKVFIKN